MSNKIIPIILCGGSGTRLWPMSRKLLPKQFLPLITDRSMLCETALRAQALPGCDAPYIVCSEEHRFLAAEQLREIGVAPVSILLEAIARNTAPALAAAAMAIAQNDPSAVMLVLPADHLIADISKFGEAVAQSAAIAATGALVTFGIVPQGPETGYGYIERGETLASSGYRVARFVEKPDAARAKTFVESGRYYWNSGMFVMTAGRYLE
ncbi:MAG: mannose-1-phosphate guanylyltransferase, partial [Burkholderiales bacterium]